MAPAPALSSTGEDSAVRRSGSGAPGVTSAVRDGVTPGLAVGLVPCSPAASAGAGSGRLVGGPRAACHLLTELLTSGGAGAAVRDDGASRPAEVFESPVSGLVADQRRVVDPAARVRPPVATRVDASAYSGHPRLHNILWRGLKVRIPSAAPRAWTVTPRSPAMTAAVTGFVSAGVLRPGRPTSCYRLFTVPKSDGSARLIYDLSALTPYMPCRPCPLPSVERALSLSAAGYGFCIKIDLRDGFYHIPLAASSQVKFGVSYDGQTYVFTRLPMGLSISPSEMQYFACATVKLVEEAFSGVKGIAYLDDFLFVARRRCQLIGIADYFARLGIVINVHKSVLTPDSRVIYLGVDIDLCLAAARVKQGVLSSVRSAMVTCSASWPMVWRQRLAGYVNFLRPCLKLPLEVVRAILDGDADSCAAVVPFMRDDVSQTFRDICLCNEFHDRSCFVDATPLQIGIVSAGLEPVSIPLSVELPIYLAEYVAALTAVMSAGDDPVTVFTDNVGVYFNLHKGRCPRPFLALLCRLFQSRKFSVGFIPSHMNPADSPSRAPLLL